MTVRVRPGTPIGDIAARQCLFFVSSPQGLKHFERSSKVRIKTDTRSFPYSQIGKTPLHIMIFPL